MKISFIEISLIEKFFFIWKFFLIKKFLLIWKFSFIEKSLSSYENFPSYIKISPLYKNSFFIENFSLCKAAV